MSLFLRLFGFEAYGIIMAVAAIVLFEGGTIAWSKILDTAEGDQRGVAYGALWFCAITSVVSSAAEIILATQLWEPSVDVGFVTLIVIASALAVNVLGALAYDQLNPDTAERHRELNRLAREAKAQASIEDSFTTHAVMQAKSKAKVVSGEIADRVGESIKVDAINRMTKSRPVVVTQFNHDVVSASAGGSSPVPRYTREQVDEMIAIAMEAANRRTKRGAVATSDDPK